MPRPLAGVRRGNILRELMAGITLLAIAIPLNIGYAQIAGLPPTAGLYALVVPTVLYTLVVSSRQVVFSPDAAGAALVSSSLGGLAAAGSAEYSTLALAQAAICGVLFVLMAALKLGFIANFLSKPILIGFVGGLALDILVGQIAKMLGVKIDSGGEFLAKVGGLIAGLDSLNTWSLLIAVSAVIVLTVGRRFLPMVPWALIVLVAATIAVMIADLDGAGVDVLGAVPPGPPVLSWPSVDWTTWLALVPSAIALTMVTTAEGLLVARSYGEKRNYPTRPNRDLLAFGLANCAAAVTSSYTMGSSTSRTAAMDQAGSRTQLPSLMLAAGTLLLLLFGTALLADIPSPVIGAIVAVAVVPLLGVAEFRLLWRSDRFEFAIGAVCFLVTLFVGSIAGIVVAFVLALVNMAKRAANPPIDVLEAGDTPRESLLVEAPTGAVTAPGVIIVRLAAPLFFANAAVFTDAVKKSIIAAADSAVRHLVIDMEAVTDVDLTGAEAFLTLRRWLRDRGIELAFSRVRPDARARLDRLALLGNATVYDTNRAAVAALADRADAAAE